MNVVDDLPFVFDYEDFNEAEEGIWPGTASPMDVVAKQVIVEAYEDLLQSVIRFVNVIGIEYVRPLSHDVLLADPNVIRLFCLEGGCVFYIPMVSGIFAEDVDFKFRQVSILREKERSRAVPIACMTLELRDEDVYRFRANLVIYDLLRSQLLDGRMTHITYQVFDEGVIVVFEGRFISK